MNSGESRRRDAVFALAVLAVAALVWREARNAPPALYDPLGPGTLPIWICGALAALALVVLVRAALGMRIGQSAQSMILGVGAAAQGDYALRPWLAVFTLIATAGYVAALTAPFSFRWSTVGFLAALGVAMGNRSRRHVAVALAIALVGGFAIDALFRKVFTVDLP